MTRTKPTAAEHAALHSDEARERDCPRCGKPTLCALVGRVAAITVRADPTPLDPLQEIQARLAGRTTYCLRQHPVLPTRLLNRGPEHITAGHCTHIVIADHQCPPTPVQERLL